MKRLLLLVALGTTFSNATSQTDWKVDGNNVSSNSKIGTNNGYDLIFETSNAERMRLASNGNLGLGVAAPLEKLHVAGSFLLDGVIRLGQMADSSADEKRYAYIGPNGILGAVERNEFIQEIYKDECYSVSNTSYFAPTWASVPGEDAGIIYTGSACPARVGIGTNTPLKTLDVFGEVSFHTPFGQTSAFSVSNEFLHYNTLSLFDDGKINITTSSYGGYDFFTLLHRDHVTETISPVLRVTDEGNIESRYYGTWQDPLAIKIGETDDILFRIMHNGQLNLRYLGTNQSELVMNIRDSQNNDMMALTSDGIIWCQGVKVRTPPFWGDFVFNKEYMLLPYNELNSYIKLNNCLPGIPSQDEIMECGLETSSELVSKQMIKIEELTLYILDLNQ